jgi:hypothetical protein
MFVQQLVIEIDVHVLHLNFLLIYQVNPMSKKRRPSFDLENTR